jgi:hypothetical protein
MLQPERACAAGGMGTFRAETRPANYGPPRRDPVSGTRDHRDDAFTA